MDNNKKDNCTHFREDVELFDDFYKFKCPHCKIDVVVMKNELNCKIFRCGQLKSNGSQIPPHTQKTECDRLRESDLIYGCAKPFIFKNNFVEICGYI